MPNRLAAEKSLYLRQHADNPVDWYPWCPEAFARAEREQKPIFLSIGYSACHWCHVMERESFSDPDVARILNEHFVCIKVDREERPDVDAFYMHVCQAMTGHGGWPLTIIMTPDKQPFFAGTYFPKHDRYGRPGLLRLLQEIAHRWQTHRNELLAYASQLVEAFSQHRSLLPASPSEELLRRAYEQLSRHWDLRYGGFGGAPKFPMVPQLLFLLRWWYRSGDSQALQMAEHTLLHMRLGGIYDHLGFGFHRYATDERWRVPHFEKMLSDQALLMLAYAQAYQIRPKPLWAQTVREVAHYCAYCLRSPEGAFYTAEDADSAGEEGAFYLWSDAELRTLLHPDEYEFLRFAFGVEPQGNLPHSGRNLLFQTAPWDALAEHFNTSTEELQEQWKRIREKLLAYRRRRIPPARDEKILTDWNGLMVAALSVAARAIGAEELLDMAQRTATWLLQQWHHSGVLFHRYADGEWAVPGFLDDYAFLLWGVLELYTTTLEPSLLETALRLGRQLRLRFWDGATGTFLLCAPEDNELPVRYHELADGSLPAGAAVACWSFLRLYHLTGEAHWREWAEQVLEHTPEALFHTPMAFPTLLAALDTVLGPTTEVLILAPAQAPDFTALVREVHRHYLPRTVLLGAAGEHAQELLRRLAPAYAAYPSRSEATAYVCTDMACQQPVTTAAELRALLPIREAPQ